MPRLQASNDAGIRYDTDTGAVRSFFDPGLVESPIRGDFSCSAISDEFLSSNADLLNLDGIDLILMEEKEGNSQITCRYGQFRNNIPVYAAWINVTMRKSDRQVISSVNTISYGIPDGFDEDAVRISSDEALKLMHQKLDNLFKGIKRSEPKLYLYKHSISSMPSEPEITDPVHLGLAGLATGEEEKIYLAWQIMIDTQDPDSNLELMISAVDGEFITFNNRRRYYTSRPAKIFRPDPVTSSQNPNLHWDSPVTVLDAELADVALENLDDPVNSICCLSGKWVRITERENPVSMKPSSETGFIYSSKDPKLLSVMAYHYLDRVIEWLRSLEVPAFNDAITGPINVDAQALNGDDNSHFAVPVNGSPYIGFGQGGTPDASDPGVITHEFGHALHYYLLGGLITPGSYEEGFNDFLSCVFRDRFNIHGYDRANPFPWDNNSTVRWDSTRRCDMKYRFDDPQFGHYGFYKKGTVYATALWNIYLETGGKSKKPDDRLKAAGEIMGIYLDMLIAVGDTGHVVDLAKGLISSDNSRTGGKNEKAIRKAFRDRGLLFQNDNLSANQ